LDPEALRRASHLEFVARSVVEGFLTGRHRSRFRGSSLEFAQHREYVHGDDLRHLDWKVWARADRLTVKQYEAETNLQAWFAVDASGSMDYGVGDRHKFSYACRLTAVLAYLLLRQSDAVGALCFAGDVRNETPARTSRAQLKAILHTLATAAPHGPGDLPNVLRKWAERGGLRGLRVLVSDLLHDAEAVLRGVGDLRRRGHDVLVVHLVHPDEWEFPFDSTTRFEGLESAEDLTCDPKSLRDEFLRIMRGHAQTVRRRCAALGVDYRFVRTDEALGAVLAALLAERMRS
jgi:uncharacterized protein (DUF58 family)